MIACSELTLLQKSVKLTSILQSLSSFTTCLSDASWLFCESLQVIQQFIRQTIDYYRDRKSKRIKLDSIEKEYLSLKLRFESVDLNQIQMFIQQLSKQQFQRRKPSTTSIPQQSSRRQEPSSCERRFHEAKLNSERRSLMEITQRETLKNNQQEINQRLTQSNEQMKHLNYQISKLKEENMQFREQILGLRKDNTLLTDTIYNKRVNQLNVIKRVKSWIKILKQQSKGNGPRLDRLLYSLVDFETRLQENTKNIFANENYEPVESLQTKRNGIILEINTMMREVQLLKQQKNYVQDQIGQLGDLYEQKKKQGKTESSSNSIGCGCSGTEPGNQHMLLLQALAIQNLLNRVC